MKPAAGPAEHRRRACQLVYTERARRHAPVAIAIHDAPRETWPLADVTVNALCVGVSIGAEIAWPRASAKSR